MLSQLHAPIPGEGLHQPFWQSLDLTREGLHHTTRILAIDLYQQGEARVTLHQRMRPAKSP